MSLETIVSAGASELGIALPPNALRKMAEYFRILEEKNREMNLTAIKGEDDAARLHFLDSLSILRYADFGGKRIIDVGTGGGFPGIPIAITVPSASVTLLDSTEKKIDFLRETCDTLGISADCVHMRAEEAIEYRGSFDIAVSRAVARLCILCELCLPMLKTGGTFIAMKASDSDEEIAEAENGIILLGGTLAEIKEYTIPGTDVVRRAVIIEKISETPKKYPRRYAQIKKSPL